jgi:hypothetical protein
VVWKNTIATDHTEAAPPSCGSTILVNIGCTANNSAALTNIPAMKVGSNNPEDDVSAAGGAPSLERSEVLMSLLIRCFRQTSRFQNTAIVANASIPPGQTKATSRAGWQAPLAKAKGGLSAALPIVSARWS